jgi:hypothetical protein
VNTPTPTIDALVEAAEQVCPEEANTPEKALATADLVRDTSFTRA